MIYVLSTGTMLSLFAGFYLQRGKLHGVDTLKFLKKYASVFCKSKLRLWPSDRSIVPSCHPLQPRFFKPSSRLRFGSRVHIIIDKGFY